MPNIRMPDGQVVGFPDDMPPDQIKQLIDSKLGNQPTLAGVGKAALGGLERGAVGMAGMAMGPAAGPATQMFSGALESAAPTYKPQNTAEEYAATVGEMAPAVAAGPGGAIRKGLTTLASGLLTEGAGQAARKYAPDYEPVARTATAIATGGQTALKEPRVVAPEAGSYGKVASDAYKSLENVGLNQHGLDRLHQTLTNRLKAEHYDPDFHGGVTSFMKLLGNKQERGGALFGEFQNLKADAKSLYSSATDKRFAHPIDETLDNFWASLTAKDIMPEAITNEGNLPSVPGKPVISRPISEEQAKAAAGAAEQAKRAYFMQKKSDLLDAMEQRIIGRSKQYSVSGMENALRTEMRQLSTQLDKKTKAAALLRGTFSPEEQSRIRQMKDGKSLANFARYIAKYNLGSVVAGGTVGAGSILASWLAGDPKAAAMGAAVLGAGTAVRGLGGAAARRQWQDFSARAKGGIQPERSVGQLAQPALRGVAAAMPTRQESLDHAGNVIGAETLDYVKKSPNTRGYLIKWMDARASGKHIEEATKYLAEAIAKEAKRPDLVDRITQELNQARGP